MVTKDIAVALMLLFRALFGVASYYVLRHLSRIRRGKNVTELLAILFPHLQTGFSMPQLFGILSLPGLSLGFLAGFFGIGGGFLAVPVMNIILGTPCEIAVGSVVCFIIGTSSSGFMRQKNIGNVRFSIIVNMVAGSILGVVKGCPQTPRCAC